MDEDQAAEQESLFPKSTGDKLREAREALGLTLADVANRTRVPIRHLEAIEQGELAGMHSSTYAIGFAKAYARAVGLDEKVIGGEVRNSPQLPVQSATAYEPYQIGDTKRLPSRGMAMVAGAIAVLLLIGVVVWYGTSLFRGSEESGSAIPENTIVVAPEATPTAAAIGGGQVRLTATDSVWMRVTDASGATLFQKTLAPGEYYDVPPTANDPKINIGRADQIQVTINGSTVPPLGTGAIKDAPISAAALQARGTAQPAPAATVAPAAAAPSGATSLPPAFRPAAPPTARPTPRPTSRPTPRAAATPENLLPPATYPTPAP